LKLTGEATVPLGHLGLSPVLLVNDAVSFVFEVGHGADSQISAIGHALAVKICIFCVFSACFVAIRTWPGLSSQDSVNSKPKNANIWIFKSPVNWNCRGYFISAGYAEIL
jgi:hypothetical protein